MTPFRKPVLPAARTAVHAGRSGESGHVAPTRHAEAQRRRKLRRSEGGFSLIFMSIFLLAAAMLMVSVLPEAGNDNAKTISDVQKLETVEEHMRSFMAFNGRRPCPADGQYPVLGPNTRYFGQEAGDPGVCQGNSAPTPNAPLGPDSSTYIVAGVIP
ncbi:MAG TPA: hypothetical protein VMV10_29855, partial [Pirellulales bacterium]|nr:hypothetical protein [Pirellulales bacterium]